MGMIASSLGESAGRPVFDKTGVSDWFQVKLEWSDAGQGGGPSIFTALQEQLGLKLESAESVFDDIVVDHIEKPQLD